MYCYGVPLHTPFCTDMAGWMYMESARSWQATACHVGSKILKPEMQGMRWGTWPNQPTLVLIMQVSRSQMVKQAIEVSTVAVLRHAPAKGNCTSARLRQQLDCTHRTNSTPSTMISIVAGLSQARLREWRLLTQRLSTGRVPMRGLWAHQQCPRCHAQFGWRHRLPVAQHTSKQT